MAVTIKGATTIRGNTTVGFSPASLFAAGEQGVWFDPSDFSTMFQDIAGANAVTAVEQTVGVLYDKRCPVGSTSFNGSSNLDFSAVGTEFNFGSGNFTIEFWYRPTAQSAYTSIIGGDEPDYPLCIYHNPNTPSGNPSAAIGPNSSSWFTNATSITFGPVTNGQWYHMALVRLGDTFTTYKNGVAIATGSTDSAGQAVGNIAKFTMAKNAGFYNTCNLSNVRIVKGVAVYTGNFTPPTGPLPAITGTVLLTCGRTWSGNPTAVLGGSPTVSALNPFSATTGNHATQSTAGSRPTLSARVNIKTKTEAFDDAAWTKSNTNAATKAIDPLGGNTANLVYPTSSGSGRYVGQDTASQLQGTYTSLIRIKAAGINFAYVYNTQGNQVLYVNLTTGATSNIGTNISNVASSIDGNGWVTLSFTSVLSSGNLAAYAVGPCDASGSTSVTANGTNGIYVWGADQRFTNQGVGLPAYQRVNTSTDYDTTGFPFYLAFNGSTNNRWLETSSINFSATNKVSLFSGLRKLSDSAQGVVTELSATIASNNGAFLLSAPNSAAANYNFSSKGTTQVDNTVTTYTAPITNVVSGLGDISAPSNIIRVNGSQVGSSTSSQGTGNYGNYALYVGRRGGSSLPYNGNLYGLIIRGAASTSDQITATENWMNTKTRAY